MGTNNTGEEDEVDVCRKVVTRDQSQADSIYDFFMRIKGINVIFRYLLSCIIFK